METTEKIESLNRQLKDEYGVDTITGIPIYRIVWSDDQFEKRLTKYTDKGIELLKPEVREMPKYRQWLRHKYVLEKLVCIELNRDSQELTVSNISYEPLWTYMDNNFNYLPPKWEVTKIVIDTVLATMHEDHTLAKYIETADPEAEAARISALQLELFGNETDVGDALAYKEGVSVPSNYKKNVH